MNMNSPNTFPYGLKYGLISGTISLLILFGLYAVNPELIFSAWMLQMLGTLVMIMLMAMAVREFKADNAGFASFKQAFQSSFFTYAVASLIAMLGQYVLIYVIDPSLQELQMKITEEATIKALEMFGADEDMIEQSLAEIEKQGTPGPGQMALGYVFSLIFGAIIAAIVAAITKSRNRDEFEELLVEE